MQLCVQSRLQPRNSGRHDGYGKLANPSELYSVTYESTEQPTHKLHTLQLHPHSIISAASCYHTLPGPGGESASLASLHMSAVQDQLNKHKQDHAAVPLESGGSTLS